MRPDGPGARRVPTGTPPTCSGTSPRCSGSGAPRSGRRPAAADESAAARSGPSRTTACSPPSTTTPAGLVAELEKADPAEPAWSWSDEQTVGFTFRRQAHEALIHRLDAEQTAGDVTPLDSVLSADGVLECLDIMYGGCPPWGTFSGLPHYVRVDCTDTGDRVWVQLGRFTGTDPDDGQTYDEDDISVVADPGTDADAVVEGPAAALDAWLWRRGDDSDITVHGDRGIYDHFREAVKHPIN